MAAVMGPPQASHPKAPPHQSRTRTGFPNPTPPHGVSKADPYYGHEYISRLCGRFITHLFACPELPPSINNSSAKLPFFIAYALHRTKLNQSVTFAALVLLQRLKARFPTARGSSGHRLFISAFMIASKVICDDTYSNKSWSIVAQGMFSLREVNQMEREMCSYLEWELNVDNTILTNFEHMVRRDFRGAGPYPTYSLQMVSKKAANATSSSTPVPPPCSSSSPIPAFGESQRSPPKPIPSSSPNSASSWSNPPKTPDTPSLSRSTSTSPASSASPATPAGIVDLSAKIAGSGSPVLSIRHDKSSTVITLKSKMYAYATPSEW